MFRACLLLLLSLETCLAANHYVRPSITNDAASGVQNNGNGATWSAASSDGAAGAFRDLPGTLVRGDTYYVSDGSNFGYYTFNDAVSGIAVITITKATPSAHGSDTGWTDSLGDGQSVWGGLIFTTSFWELDGVTGGGPTNWEGNFGFKSDIGGGYNLKLDGTGPVSNVTFRHFECQNGGAEAMNNIDNCLYAVESASDVTISYCYWHDVSIAMLLTDNSNRFTVEYSKFRRNGNQTLDIYHRVAWSATTDDNVIIRYCVFEDIQNTAIIGLVNGSGTANNWQIYGNVFSRTGNYTDVNASSLIQCKYSSPTFIVADNWLFCNNTIIGLSGIGAYLFIPQGTNCYAFNNMYFSNRVDTLGDFGVFNRGYNWFGWNTNRTYNTNIDASSAGAELGTQIGTTNANPFVNWPADDYSLVYNTLSGTNTVLFIPANATDFAGHARVDGSWSRGALQYVPSSPPSSAITGNAVIRGNAILR